MIAQSAFATGADSLAGDKLGAFNLSMKGHAACLEFIKSFGLPMLVLGGGGYRISNVSRCWAYETGVILGKSLLLCSGSFLIVQQQPELLRSDIGPCTLRQCIRVIAS